MQNKFKNHIYKNLPFLKDKKLLIAISGGVDSVVLAQLLTTLNFTVSLAHCNFQLRGLESDLDEEFVINLGEKLNLQTFTTNVLINPNGSIQLAAREFRYEWFQELIETHNFDFVLTAHHADDILETFLINLTRGSGLDGFTGIPEINGNIIRPLLPFSREEIKAYATSNNISWREDQSNASTKYVRNKIRHQIAPVLKEINPNLLTSFAKTIDNLKESKEIINDRIKDVVKEITTEKDGILKFEISKIQQLKNPKAYLYEILKKYQFTEWNDVFNLLSAQSGKQILSESHILLKDRNFLILSDRDFEIAQEPSYFIHENTKEIKSPIQLTFEEVTQENKQHKNTIYVGAEKLQFPLIVRKWENGDYFYPLGMQGKKKLSKYFKDEKLSLFEKKDLWLLCNSKNEIIWVIGKRQDQRFVSKTASKNIKITLIKHK
ncbi:tRNA lysidine(34) synthetase TilS [Polaribacter aestuariivivens]|uniref:tRNA(Ile)-lysidine synthase n=1 Tax=Polaribacter aestuariivivens TaxID=2304626 RepID=A0A5S3NB22_9FLAO|nr:tRNA lysidine(34) synthetase TilS [Polaribacter aestuariivivens]TMM32393.1 tRNA lysidine(34) synthetase TilS [Polaribacter aestuariivivens]